VPTRLNVTQQFDAPPATVYGLMSDEAFQQGRLDEVGGLEAQVVSMDETDDGVRIVTRQNIPASVLPSMVASMVPGDPATERIEDWHIAGDGYSADFSVTVKGAPASLKGTMVLNPVEGGSALTTTGEAAVPIPLFGAKIEAVIVEQVAQLLEAEADYTRSRLSA
jgi:hypothetical protein